VEVVAVEAEEVEAAVEAVEVEVEVEAEVEFQQDPPHSQENWEAIHQKSFTETEKKARPSCLTSFSIEE